MLARTVIAMSLSIGAVFVSGASNGTADATQRPSGEDEPARAIIFEQAPVVTEGSTPADQDESSLLGRWQLERIDYEGKDSIQPSSPEKYRVEFRAGGVLLAQLDCNRGRGGYSVSDSTLKVNPILATLMACGNDSLDREFSKALQSATSFRRDNDRLVLSMPNGGTMHLTLLP